MTKKDLFPLSKEHSVLKGLIKLHNRYKVAWLRITFAFNYTNYTICPKISRNLRFNAWLSKLFQGNGNVISLLIPCVPSFFFFFSHGIRCSIIYIHKSISRSRNYVFSHCLAVARGRRSLEASGARDRFFGFPATIVSARSLITFVSLLG